MINFSEQGERGGEAPSGSAGKQGSGSASPSTGSGGIGGATAPHGPSDGIVGDASPLKANSEQSEREGEAPSGFAGGGGDASPLIRQKEASTSIVFFRHGKTGFPEERFYSRKDDPSLSAEGRSQAERLGRWVKGADLKVLYASPLKRTMETAKWLSDGLNLKIVPGPGLEERMMGEWEGLTPAEVKARYPDQFESWKRDLLGYTPPGGESWRGFAERIIQTVDRIKEAHFNQRIAIVTHVGPIRVLVSRAMEMAEENHKRITLGYGSATRIDYTKKWGNLCYLGVIPFEQQP